MTIVDLSVTQVGLEDQLLGKLILKVGVFQSFTIYTLLTTPFAACTALYIELTMMGEEAFTPQLQLCTVPFRLQA